MMNLPIDIVANTSPPRFRWRQTVETPVGTRVQEYDGVLPPSMEQAVEALVQIAKQLEKDNAALVKENALLKAGVPNNAPTPPSIATTPPVVKKK